MALTRPFTTTNPLLTNFSFTNIIEGLAGINFYAGNGLNASASNVDVLSSTIFDSNSPETSTPANAASSTLIDTQEYALSEATIPNTLKGKCIVTFGWGMRANNNNQGQSSGHIKVALLVNNTNIGEGKTGERTSTGTAYTIAPVGNSTVTFDVTETQIRIGDELKIVFYIYGYRASGSSGGYVVNGHDPSNGDGSYIKPSTDDVYTRIKAQIPFKLDL